MALRTHCETHLSQKTSGQLTSSRPALTVDHSDILGLLEIRVSLELRVQNFEKSNLFPFPQSIITAVKGPRSPEGRLEDSVCIFGSTVGSFLKVIWLPL